MSARLQRVVDRLDVQPVDRSAKMIEAAARRNLVEPWLASGGTLLSVFDEPDGSTEG